MGPGGPRHVKQYSRVLQRSVQSFREGANELHSAFVQDEITLVPTRLYLTAGAKFEDNPDSGLGVQPSISIAWLANDKTTLWASVFRALGIPCARRGRTVQPGGITRPRWPAGSRELYWHCRKQMKAFWPPKLAITCSDFAPALALDLTKVRDAARTSYRARWELPSQKPTPPRFIWFPPIFPTNHSSWGRLRRGNRCELEAIPADGLLARASPICSFISAALRRAQIPRPSGWRKAAARA